MQYYRLHTTQHHDSRVGSSGKKAEYSLLLVEAVLGLKVTMI